MDSTLLIPFALATFIFTVTPGPGGLFCAAQSLAGGTRAGLRAAVGLHAGGYVHVIAAAFGMTILLETVPALFTVFKIIGVGILVWMGIALILQKTDDETPLRAPSTAASFGKAFMIEALNPTTALFFLAFLPQFVSPDAALPVPLQFLILGTITGFAFSVSDVLYAVTAGHVRKRVVTSRRLRDWAQRLGGLLLISLGVNLALKRTAP